MIVKKNELVEIQSRLLKMMKWFHEFCQKNSLRYYALGGTMLGAARHKGFIPWDDDIDVGMPRKDYVRFAELMGREKNGNYILETPYSNAKEYCYPISKLYDTQTTLIEHKRYPIVRGVFLDIFPLDGLGNSREECVANYKPINKKYDLFLACTAGIRKGRSFYKNAAVVVMGGITKFILDEKSLVADLDQLCASHDYDQYDWCGNLLGAYRFKEVMPKAVLNSPVEYQFENIMIYGAKYYDEYLTSLYGEWRKLPPKEMQISHHDFISCDLTKSYLKYKK